MIIHAFSLLLLGYVQQYSVRSLHVILSLLHFVVCVCLRCVCVISLSGMFKDMQLSKDVMGPFNEVCYHTNGCIHTHTHVHNSNTRIHTHTHVHVLSLTRIMSLSRYNHVHTLHTHTSHTPVPHTHHTRIHTHAHTHHARVTHRNYAHPRLKLLDSVGR